MNLQKKSLMFFLLCMYPYLVCLSQDFLEVFEKEQEIILKETSEILISSIQDMDVDSEGNIWIIDWDAGQLVKFDRNGDNPVIIARKGQGPGELYRPQSIFIDKFDHIYVANILHRISEFDENGKFIYSFVPIDGHRPTTCIAVFKDKIILGGMNEGLNRNNAKMIHIYTKKGKYVKSFYKIDDEFIKKNLFLYRSAYFDITSDGILCAIQPVNYKITLFNINGDSLNSIGTKPGYYKTTVRLTDRIESNKKMFEGWESNFTYVRDVFIDNDKVVTCSHNSPKKDLMEYYIDIYNLKSGFVIFSGIKSDISLERVKNGKYYFTKIIEDNTEREYKNAIEVYWLNKK